MEKEIWKTIKKHPTYMVSNLGNVKSLDCKVRYTHAITGKEHFRNRRGRLLSVGYTKGYRTISLNDIKYRVCRLVAIEFIPNPENKPQVNHIDCNKANDKVSNLEWVTAKENMQHAMKNNLYENSKKQNKLRQSKKVICLRTGVVFDSITDFAKSRNIDSSNISRCLSGRYNKNHDVAFYEE